ncbi:MAG TPA: MmcQ/YjbR family DNA-binding protein [Vicinamibacterales bacterium]|nr:MmcQ/YjbR family DNA-binding protein [Vicinamibacterales bacterium]
MCLALPETRERIAWGHPMFRAGSKTFCAFEIIKGRPTIAFKVSPKEARKLLRPDQFFATPFGRNWWISIWVDGPIDWDVVGALLDRSYRSVALKRMLSALDAKST